MALEYLLRGGKSEIFNLGSEHGLSVREIVEAAREVTGVDFPVKLAPRRDGDPAVLIASNRKAREVLGWVPQHSRCPYHSGFGLEVAPGPSQWL